MLLRRLVSDLLLPNPTPERLHIIPTTRDPKSGLALSSRNAYLSAAELERAPALYAALRAAQNAWASGANKHKCLRRAEAVLEEARLLGAVREDPFLGGLVELLGEEGDYLSVLGFLAEYLAAGRGV